MADHLMAAKEYLEAFRNGCLLNIVACSRTKIWNKRPDACKTVPARRAYDGGMFKQGAQCFEDLKRRFDREPPWYVLSAKYGFLEPDQEIGDYNVSFSNTSDRERVVSQDVLMKQWEEKHMEQYAVLFVWGGSAYVERIKRLTETGGKKIEHFFAPADGLPIGKALKALRDFRTALSALA